VAKRQENGISEKFRLSDRKTKKTSPSWKGSQKEIQVK